MGVLRVAAAAFAVIGCGPSGPPPAEERLTCGGTEPVRLLDAPRLGSATMIATLAGERFVIDGTMLGDDAEHWGSSVDPCGEDPVELVPLHPTDNKSELDPPENAGSRPKHGLQFTTPCSQARIRTTRGCPTIRTEPS